METYLKDPAAIEQESFLQIRSLLDLSAYDEIQAQVVMRLVHTCGNPLLVEDIRISAGAVDKGIAAIKQQKAIFCDVEMVKHGLTKRMLKQTPQCYVNDEQVKQVAQQRGETRSMTAVDRWLPELADSIVLIGNAPTALFRLLELIEAGEAEKPALIIATPVGFVGAKESKAALWRMHKELGIECIAVMQRHGGSAMTAAAFNSLLRVSQGIRF